MLVSRRSKFARISALVAVTALVSGLATQASAATAAAAPVNPARTVLFQEGFQNTTNGGGLPIANYVGTAGDTFTADGRYLDYTQCNGVDLYGTETLGGSICAKYANPRQIRINAENSMRGFATALGGSQFNGLGSSNRAVAFLTANLQLPRNLIELETNRPATVASFANKFLGFSINSSQVCRDGLSNFVQPSFQFFSKTSAGLTAQSGSVNPCQLYWDRGTLNGSAPILSTSDQVGFRIVNTSGGGLTGNDMGLDDFTVWDETPQVHFHFTPEQTYTNSPSTLVLTVNNTSELQAKNGWSFQNTLPAGLVVADPAKVSTDCPAGALSTSAGSSVLTMKGNLSSGMKYCSMRVNVTSATVATYTDAPVNFSKLVGVKVTSAAKVDFIEPPIFQ